MSGNGGALAGLRRWARLRGRSALVVIGALDGDAALAFVDRLASGAVLPIPIDAQRPGRADVLVVVGRISRKLAPVVVSTARRLATGAVVLAFDTDEAVSDGAVRVDELIKVDVLVRGLPPDDATLLRALSALDDAFIAARVRVATGGAVHDAEPA